MITRAYQNAKGERQEICLSQEDWEKVTEESLEMMLGLNKAPEPVVEPAVVAASVVKAPAKKKK